MMRNSIPSLARQLRNLSYISVLMTACRGNADPPSAEPARVHAPSRDAAEARLAPARERFWADYLGTGGSPGPKMLAYCHDVNAAANVDVALGIAMDRGEPDSCQLLVQAPASIDEARLVLARWGSGSVSDDADRLDARVVDNRDALTASWATFAPLEQIIGTNGNLLVGFDAAKAVGKTPLEMHDAVRPPLVLDADCTADGCGATGKRPPGGSPVTINALRRTPNISVKIETRHELMQRLYELIDASLGEHDGHHIYRRDGVRYAVHEWPGQPVLQIEIAKDQ